MGLTVSLNTRRASQIASLVALATAVAVLFGWWADAPLMSSWGAGLPAASPLGALCIAGLSFALLCDADRRRSLQDLALALGVAATATAAIDMAHTAFAVERPGGPAAIPAATALGLVLAGSAFLFSRFARHNLVAIALGSIAAALGAIALLGYLTGINTLHDVTSINSPPLPTAVGLLCIALALILRIGARPTFRQPRPLWHLLAVLGWAIVAPLLLFGAYAGARMADAQVAQVRGELTDEVRTLSADVDREILGEFETLEALAASPSLQRGDYAAFQRQAEAPLASHHSGNVVLFDRDAHQIFNTSVPFGTPMPAAVTAEREAVRRAFATGKTQVTSLFEGPVARDVLFSIVMPVKVDSEFRYALARSPSQHALSRVVASNQLPPGRTAAVIDAAHRIIAQSGPQPPETVVGNVLPRAQWPRNGSSGVFEFTDLQGQPSLEAYTRSELTGWGVTVWATKAVLGAPLRTLWRTLSWMALLAVSLVVALALWVGQIMSRSVGQAARAAVALGEGHPLPPSTTPVVEVNTLMAELEETAAKRQAAVGSLRNSERRLQLALTAAQLGSWQYDPVRRVLSGGDRTMELFDFAGGEVSTDELIGRVHPDDRKNVLAAFQEVLDPANPQRSSVEFRYRRRNGDVRWLETLGLAHFDGDSGESWPASVFGTVADVTERKEIEEERRARAEKEHLLMREMKHRAKNMLSVVDAIAHQTATGSPEDFVKRFSERIQSLSANQDLLLRTEWKGVEVEALVHAQLAHFADLIGARISAEGPRLRLKASCAQAIGLALHELATNAGKYGALSADTGRVAIRWAVDGGAFTISWTESGGPSVSEPKRRGFGSIVTGTMAERSVCGTVDLDYAPAGVAWRLSCPVANALEAGEWAAAGEREMAAAPPPCPLAGEDREGGRTELTMR